MVDFKLPSVRPASSWVACNFTISSPRPTGAGSSTPLEGYKPYTTCPCKPLQRNRHDCLTHPHTSSLCPLQPTLQTAAGCCSKLTSCCHGFAKKPLPTPSFLRKVFQRENLTEFKTLSSLVPISLPSIIFHYRPVMVCFMCQVG